MSFLLCLYNDILLRSDFERNTFFLMSKSTKKVAGDRHIAGENNGRFFKFKVAEKFYQINTNNFHNYDHAWKWSRGSVSAPPWRYFCRFWLRSPLRFVRDITYNDNMAITFFYHTFFVEKGLILLPLTRALRHLSYIKIIPSGSLLN